MGLNDAAEMLEAAKAQAVLDERTIARVTAERDVQIVEAKRLQRELDAAEQLIGEQARTLQDQAGVLFQAGEKHGILWRERHDLEQTLDRVRAVLRRVDAEALQHPPGVFRLADEITEIVGTQAPPSGDEHDRTA